MYRAFGQIEDYGPVLKIGRQHPEQQGVPQNTINKSCRELNGLSENISYSYKDPGVDGIGQVKVGHSFFGVHEHQDVDLGHGVSEVKVLLI